MSKEKIVTMHARDMHYPKKVMNIVERTVNELIDDMDLAKDPFNQECIEKYYAIYQNMMSTAG